jgi:predicted XRE-type DNA-binding protein
MSEDLEVVRGAGNIFADFGDEDAQARRMKAVIAAEIIRVMDERKLTVRAAARAARIDPSDAQRIRNADLSRFTIDRLVRIAWRLGRAVEMTVTAAPGSEAA